MSKKKSPGDIAREKKDTINRTRQLNKIYERDGGICQLCLKPCSRQDASRDHIKEIRFCTKEEARSDENMVLAHKKCNEERARESQLTEKRLLRVDWYPITNTYDKSRLRTSIANALNPEQLEKLQKLCESD